MPPPPLFVLLAGPNGAGKTTLYRETLRPLAARFEADMGPFLNADDYARVRWGPDHAPERDYEAAQHIAAERERRMVERLPIVTETVFSHPSKQQLLDKASQLGYRVHLEIVIVPLATSIARVAARVRAGGHDVPTEKLRNRYERTDRLLAEVIPRVGNVRLWENAVDTRAGTPSHTRLARFEDGYLVVQSRIPSWMPPHLLEAIRAAPRGPHPASPRG